jgi:hypothetical protein
MNKPAKTVLLVCGIFLAVLFGGLAYSVITSPPPVALYIDNCLDKPVTVRMDQGETSSLDAHSIAKHMVKTGVHKVEISDNDGKSIESRDVDCKKIGYVYIFNIKSAGRYAMYTMAYGGAKLKEVDMVKPLETKAFYVEGWSLCEAFPESIRVKGGGITLSRIGHYPLHKDYPCCQELYKSLNR